MELFVVFEMKIAFENISETLSLAPSKRTGGKLSSLSPGAWVW